MCVRNPQPAFQRPADPLEHLGSGCELEAVARPWAHLWKAALANPSSSAAYFLEATGGTGLYDALHCR